MKSKIKKHAPDLTNVCAMPKNLGQAIGYDGPADLLGVWWERAGDELAWCDGVSTLVGANHWIYLNFLSDKLAWMISEARPAELITDIINIGSSDQEATWWLILDLKNEDIYTAPRNQAQAMLRVAAGEIKIVDIEHPIHKPNLYAQSLCSCMSGWLYDPAAYECKKHDLCAGSGFIYAQQANTR